MLAEDPQITWLGCWLALFQVRDFVLVGEAGGIGLDIEELGEFLIGKADQVQVEAEVEMLRAELDVLEMEVAEMRQKTRRLSDEFLDLDLLDTQAREILGLMRADEIIIR